MGAIDLLWHFGNLLAPAVGVTAWTVLLVRLLWRPTPGAVPAWRLLKWGVAVGWAGMACGLVWTGRDGRLLVHALTVTGVAMGLWWAGFVRPSR